jgi:gluconate 2-dehydrogenase gamma chain
MAQNKLSRRHFIQMSAVGLGSLLLFPRCAGQKTKSAWRFFTEKEASLVDAIVEQIVPADEWVGAKGAGVTNFIDKQLVGPYVRFQEKYRVGLSAIETTCNKLYAKQFDELSGDGQTDFLKKMEAGKVLELLGEKKTETGNNVWENGFDRVFFNLMCDHTMQGYYGSPRHGGNKDYASYRMIGLDYPFIVGQNRYKSE